MNTLLEYFALKQTCSKVKNREKIITVDYEDLKNSKGKINEKIMIQNKA